MYEWIKTDAILVKKNPDGSFQVDRLNHADSVNLSFVPRNPGRHAIELHANGQFYDFGDDFMVMLGMMDQVEDLQSPVIFHGEAGVFTPA